MAAGGFSSLANRIFLRGCAVARPEEWSGEEQALRSMAPADWRRVVENARQHGFVGLLSRNLAWAQERIEPRIPILGQLGALQRGQLVQHLGRKAAARRVTQRLAQAGIPFVVFKGVVLAEEVYGDLSLRGFRDCDVMVPRDRVDEAYQVALDLGYRLTQFTHARDYADLGSHAAGMVHRDGTGLDLHWSIAADMLAPGKVAIVWEHCRPSRPGEFLLGLRLSPEMTLVHLAKHFHSHQYGSVKPLVDFYVAARRMRDQIDSRELVALARSLDLLPVLEIATQLCERWFIPGSMPPLLGARRPAMPARFAPRVVTDNLMLNAARSSRIGNWLRYLLAAGSLASCRRSVREALVPGKLVLAQFFNGPYRPGMYPRYYWRQLVKVVTLSSK